LYIPFQYWREEGKIYQKNFRPNKHHKLHEKLLVNLLKKLEFSTVLEVGCGFGRITKLMVNNFKSIKEYDAIDLSPDQIENAKRYVNSQLVKYQVSEIQAFNPGDKRYDLVLISEVLLHVMPSEIKAVMEKLVSLSNKHVVNIDYYEDVQTLELAEYNFLHQYEQIYKSIPDVQRVERIRVQEKKLFGKSDFKELQSIFHAEVAH
jgi:2-polyprenyl-3-methyl-5-hydroxy-6-metoxy-1,4-benzoquinol methylase